MTLVESLEQVTAPMFDSQVVEVVLIVDGNVICIPPATGIGCLIVNLKV